MTDEERRIRHNEASARCYARKKAARPVIRNQCAECGVECGRNTTCSTLCRKRRWIKNPSNRDRDNARKRQWAKDNRWQAREWRVKNRDKYLAQAIAHAKRYEAANPQKCREYHRRSKLRAALLGIDDPLWVEIRTTLFDFRSWLIWAKKPRTSSATMPSKEIV